MTQTVLLGDVVKVGDGLHGTPTYALDGRIPFINGNNLENGKIIIKKDTKMCNIVEFNKYDKKLSINTILLSINGTIGNLAKYDGLDYILGKSACYLDIADTKIISKDYLYYLCSDRNFQDFIKTGATGTTIKNVPLKAIRGYKFYLPNTSAQKKIANILSSLDEKIELNRKMNETLEQMGQALFRYYFVDNVEAEDWGIVNFGQKIHPKRGKSLSSKNMKAGTIPVVSGGLQPAGLHSDANTIAPVITVSASGANAGFVALWGSKIWSADSTFIDKTITDNVYFYYIFLKINQDKIYGMQTGAAQPHIYPSHLELLEIPNASDYIISEFNSRVTANFEMIEKNKKEIQTLTTLRDTLLPRLINGKVKL